MKTIVTGGAGFIGSNLIRHLLKDESNSVFNIDNLCFPGSLHTIADLSTHNRYSFAKKDIADRKSMENILADFLPDAIIHLAAESHVDRSIDGPDAFIHSNIIGTFSLLEAFRNYYANAAPARRPELRFLHVSTDEVFGSLKQDEPAFDECHPYAPNSPYSASKAASDHLVRAWHSTYKLPVLLTNCSNNYGPFQFPEKLIPVVITKALAGEHIPVYGKGENIRDWLYVDDHVRAIELVLKKGNPGESYNIGANNEISNLDLVKMICDLLDKVRPARDSYHKLIKFVDDRPGHDLRYSMDSTKIETTLGWQAKQQFHDGLLKTINWYIDNQLWCEKVSSGSYSGQRLGLGK